MDPDLREPSDRGRWYVVTSKPRQEHVARENLKRQGYRAYLPQVVMNKRRRGVWGPVTEPLFPGYLFVCLTLGQDDPAPIRSTVGCMGLVTLGKVLAPVPEPVMATLLNFGDELRQPAAAFNPGDLVWLEDGPFEGLEAVFDMSRGADRARVLIELLGRQQRIEVSVNHLTLR